MTRRILYTGLRAPEATDDVRLVHAPAIAVQYRKPDDEDGARGFLVRKPRLLFPSRHAVLGFAKWLSEVDELASVRGAESFAVGASTAAVARERLGLDPRTPDESTARGLTRLLDTLAARPALFVAGEDRRPEIPEWLADHPSPAREIHVYRTERLANDDLRREFHDDPQESIVFTSPSTVQGFLKSTDRSDLRDVASRLIAIGPTTADAIEAAQGTVNLTAPEPDAGRLLEALRAASPETA